MTTVIETEFNAVAPIYRPVTDEEIDAIRVAVQIGSWVKSGYPLDRRTLIIDGQMVNVEFRLIPLHDPFPGHGPYTTWTVISEGYQLEPPRIVHKGDIFGYP